MSIQNALEIDKKCHIVELIGFPDYGKEGILCHTIRAGTQEKRLGNYVLQLLFLGTSGFRFPFTLFVTNSIQASELYGLFGKQFTCCTHMNLLFCTRAWTERNQFVRLCIYA